jgi:hypothetical protein
VFWKINRTVFLDADRTMDNIQNIIFVPKFYLVLQMSVPTFIIYALNYFILNQQFRRLRYLFTGGLNFRINRYFRPKQLIKFRWLRWNSTVRHLTEMFSNKTLKLWSKIQMCGRKFETFWPATNFPSSVRKSGWFSFNLTQTLAARMKFRIIKEFMPNGEGEP